MGYLVLALVAVIMVIIFLKEKAPTEEKLQEQQQKFEALLKEKGVPKEHCKVVISQSRTYNLYNCPAVLWVENGVLKTLLFSITPKVVESDLEDYKYISSQPLVDFKRFDGAEYPDWMRQSKYVKELFLPYVDLTKSSGGINYEKQMYWIGTICVYAPSLANCLRMFAKPLSEYEMTIDNFELMKKDGSIPEEILAAYEAEQEAVTEIPSDDKPKTMEMEAALQNLKEALEIVRMAEEAEGIKAEEWIAKVSKN